MFYWEQDHNLYNFTVCLYDYIRQYSTNLFRKIYKDVFGDNIYRDNFFQESRVLEYDCKQLFQNLKILFSFNRFNDLLKQLMKTNSNINHNRKKYNFDIKCTMNVKQLEDENNKNYKLEIISELFDTISETQIKTFI